MKLGFHVRSWLVAFIISLLLIMVVAIPPPFIKESKKRALYVGLMIPTAVAVYAVTLYFVFHCPLRSARRAYAEKTTVGSSSYGSALFTKELRKLDSAIGAVLKDDDLLNRFVAAYGNGNNNNADAPRLRRVANRTSNNANRVNARSVTPERTDGNEPVAEYSHHHITTPATVARDIFRVQAPLEEKGKPKLSVQVFSAPASDVDDAGSDAALYSLPPSPREE